MQPYRYSGHRSQPPSLRRSTRRRAHDPYEMETQHLQHGLPHAHSDPELRHLARRDFEISRQELRDSKRSKHADIYEHDYPYDARRCPWDCACHREHAEPRHHRRVPANRYSTRSERWTHSMMYEEEFEQDRQPRYSYSLPRGRHSSRRLRAKTVDPRYSEYRQCPYARYHHHHQRSAAVVPTHYEHHPPSTHEAPKIAHCQHHQQQQQLASYEEQAHKPAERVRKTPIITKGYTIEELPQEDCNVAIKKTLRSQSMPRATHLHPRDALYIPVEEEETGRRLRRSRAMSVMPRHSGGYNRGVENYELSDLRSHAHIHAPYKNAECTDCCLHERNDYRYATEATDRVLPAPPLRASYNSHTSYQGRTSSAHDYGHRRSRKPVRHERAEKLPPSPRIMSPMGFAVKRQTRQRPSFDYDDDSLNGWHDNYDDMTVKNRPVPIWLCVFLVISYILGGAVLFAYWEQWSFLDSAYFCFITLTTIGFGDFVPAKGVKDESEQSIAYCSLYLLFGIALLAMSFNLVQEEFIANVKEVARRLGIIKDEEDENE